MFSPPPLRTYVSGVLVYGCYNLYSNCLLSKREVGM